MRVKDNREGLDRLEKVLGNAVVQVGIFEAEGAASKGEGSTVLDVASYHEFGLGVPERSFLRGWFDENEAKAKEAIKRMAEAVVKGDRTKEDALDILGAAFVGQIQQRISDRIPPPLADSTVKAKGSDVPLIDTGQLRSSITWRSLDK